MPAGRFTRYFLQLQHSTGPAIDQRRARARPPSTRASRQSAGLYMVKPTLAAATPSAFVRPPILRACENIERRSESVSWCSRQGALREKLGEFSELNDLVFRV